MMASSNTNSHAAATPTQNSPSPLTNRSFAKYTMIAAKIILCRHFSFLLARSLLVLAVQELAVGVELLEPGVLLAMSRRGLCRTLTTSDALLAHFTSSNQALGVFVVLRHLNSPKFKQLKSKYMNYMLKYSY